MESTLTFKDIKHMFKDPEQKHYKCYGCAYLQMTPSFFFCMNKNADMDSEECGEYFKHPLLEDDEYLNFEHGKSIK